MAFTLRQHLDELVREGGMSRLWSLLVAFVCMTIVAEKSNAQIFAGVADPGASPQKVSVLDRGNFIIVEAQQATLREVVEVLGTQLKVTFFNTERIDLSRVVDGRRAGSMRYVLEWFIPGASFILLYEEQRPGSTKEPRLDRIGFLESGSKEQRTANTSIAVAPPLTNAFDTNVPNVNNGRGSGGDGGSLKLDLQDSRQTEIKTVAEQLQAAAFNTKLAMENQAQAPNGAPPGFPRSGDVAQLTLNQQIQRTQALAVEQLRALVNSLPR
jgi:hypothetical protein